MAQGSEAEEARRRRLAEALRENLKRRKAQARAQRSGPSGAPDGPGKPPEGDESTGSGR